MAGLGVFGDLVGGALEVGVTASAHAAGHEDNFLAFGQHFGFHFAGFLVTHDGAQRHFNHDIFSVVPGAIVSAAITAIFGEDVLIPAKVQKRPELGVAAQHNMASATTVAAVRPARALNLVRIKCLLPAPPWPDLQYTLM